MRCARQQTTDARQNLPTRVTACRPPPTGSCHILNQGPCRRGGEFQQHRSRHNTHRPPAVRLAICGRPGGTDAPRSAPGRRHADRTVPRHPRGEEIIPTIHRESRIRHPRKTTADRRTRAPIVIFASHVFILASHEWAGLKTATRARVAAIWRVTPRRRPAADAILRPRLPHTAAQRRRHFRILGHYHDRRNDNGSHHQRLLPCHGVHPPWLRV